jgi:sec-independent protein translocase protein TatA
MFGLGPSELAILAVIVLLIFGARRLPEIGKGLGGAVREFKNLKKDMDPQKLTEDAAGEEKASKGEGDNESVENKVKNKVLEQVPGVKKAMDVKKKAEQIRKIVK